MIAAADHTLGSTRHAYIVQTLSRAIPILFVQSDFEPIEEHTVNPGIPKERKD